MEKDVAVALSRGKRWFLGLVSIPIVVFPVLFMWASGWLTPKPPELRVIENSFEPYVVESGTLVESHYDKGWNPLFSPDDPFANFSYEPADGYTIWELSEELREAAIEDGWLIKAVTDERDDYDTPYAHCRWYGKDRVLGDAGEFEYSLSATHECREGTTISLIVRYEGEVD